jgi:predicted DNA binding CopG/RHH family protein
MAVFVFLEPDTGGRERNYMKNVSYTNAPAEVDRALDNATVIKDFLPLPEDLVRKTQKEKITIAIDKDSLVLFKQYAQKHNSKYQTMINGVLTSYADKFLKR